MELLKKYKIFKKLMKMVQENLKSPQRETKNDSNTFNYFRQYLRPVHYTEIEQ